MAMLFDWLQDIMTSTMSLRRFAEKLLYRTLFLGLFIIPIVPQAVGQNILTVRDTVEPNWSEDGKSFWFASKIENRETEFILFDAVKGTREPLFDRQIVEKAVNSRLGNTTTGKPFAIKVQKYDSQTQLVTLNVTGEILNLNRNNGEWSWKGKAETVGPTRTLSLSSRPSRQSDERVQFRLHNHLEKPIEIVWIDFGGEEQVYGVVDPGKSFETGSFATHVWFFRFVGGKAIGYLQLSNDAEIEVALDQKMVDSAISEPPPATGERRNRRRNRNRRDSIGISQPEGFKAEVRDHNLWLTVASSVQSTDSAPQASSPTTIPLTTNASEQDSFHRSVQRERLLNMQYEIQDAPESEADVVWTNDSKFLIAWQTTVVPERMVRIVRSLDDDGQPGIVEYPYAKPGDSIPIRRPRIFDVTTRREVTLSLQPFIDPWDIRLERISSDNRYAWFSYNERGHQRIQLIQVELATGATKVVIDETSNTFLHYSDGAKYSLRWLDDTTALWSSEKSGWNHLYRIQMVTGEVLNAVTQGEWNVKRIDDIQDGLITFYAVGLATDQDPYHEHFCSVRVDGSDFRQLTDKDGTHSVTWSPNRDYFLDRYSRVDLPPVHELKTRDGTLVGEVERAEIVGPKEQNSAKPILPERFMAYGRDGKTPIWGVVYWPKSFDPTKSYPVIESIYAGPHDHHVPKSFQRGRSFHEYTSAGFVVVQIDGMGTAWRSKAFHDVCYRNLRDAGFPDRIAWIKALGEKHPCLDLSRIGVFGGSAGGQNAMAALLWHNDFYKVAVADCGCHDNRMDKIWWNEQWMGKVESGDHYSQNSNRDNAHLMEGKLMLVVGELDTNVDPASTTQVVAKLIEANKDFEFLLMTGAGHGACESPYGRRRRLEFFQKHLQP